MSFIHQAKINNVNYDIIGSCYYGICETSATTTEKVVTITNADDFVLVPGAQVAIKFTNINSATSPKLNVNNTGAINILYKNSTITSADSWEIDQVVIFIYDGNNWNISFLNTNAEMTGATSSAAGSSGLVPIPAAGDNEKFLRGDGTWAKTSGIFAAVYNVTPYADIKAAFDAGKLLLLIDSTIIAHHTGIVPTSSSYPFYFTKPLDNAYTGGQIIAYSVSLDTDNGNVTKWTKDISYVLATPEEANDGDVLTYNAADDWWYAQAPTGGVFIATYGTTTNAEIEAAYQAGKLIVCLQGDIERGYLINRTSASYHLFSNGKDYFSCFNDSWNRKAIIGDVKGASSSNPGSSGLVPAPDVGEQNKFLKGDGTWGTLAPQKIALVATAGQTSFEIPFEYDSLSSNLTVYYNGILMKETDNYTVNTDNNTVNLVDFSAEAEDVITIMGILGAQSIDFGQEAIDAINRINATVEEALDTIDTKVEEAIDTIDTKVEEAEKAIDDKVLEATNIINTLIQQLPENWDDYIIKGGNNQMSSGGKITMDSTYDPSGNYDITTKIYVDEAISTATSNIVTDVFYAGTSAPSNTKLLWIDTNSSNGNGLMKYYNGSSWIAISAIWS